MIAEKLNTIEVPELPKLTNGFVVVQEDAWNTLITYVQLQSDVINSLTSALENLSTMHDIHYKHNTGKIQRLEQELKDIALALEGAFEDE